MVRNTEPATAPVITVGLWVYNEEEHLAAALDSVLAQEMDGLEILIGDNASTDRTPEIAAEYAAKFPSIQHIHRPENLGALANLNDVMRRARGKYFVAAGGHDLWSEGYLRGLKNAMDARPDAVLAYGITKWIDEGGEPVDRPTGFTDTSGDGPLTRFNHWIWTHQDAMYGMYRVEALHRTRLQLPIVGSGAVALSELALLGHLIVVPDVVRYRRINRSVESREERIQRYHTFLFRRPRRPLLPHWRVPWAFVTAPFALPLPWTVRWKAAVLALGSGLRFANELRDDLAKLPSRLLRRLP